MNKQRIAVFTVLIMLLNVFSNSIFIFKEYGIVEAQGITEPNGDAVDIKTQDVAMASLPSNTDTVDVDGVKVDREFYEEAVEKQLSNTKINIYDYFNKEMGLSIDQMMNIEKNKNHGLVIQDPKMDTMFELVDINVQYKIGYLGNDREKINEYIVQNIEKKKIMDAGYLAYKLDIDIDSVIDEGVDNEKYLKSIEGKISSKEFQLLSEVSEKYDVNVNGLMNEMERQNLSTSFVRLSVIDRLEKGSFSTNREKESGGDDTKEKIIPTNLISNNGENISLNNGALSVTGLGSAIIPTYNSNSANEKEIRGKVERTLDDKTAVWYVKLVEGENPKPGFFQVAGGTEAEAQKNAEKNGLHDHTYTIDGWGMFIGSVTMYQEDIKSNGEWGAPYNIGTEHYSCYFDTLKAANDKMNGVVSDVNKVINRFNQSKIGKSRRGANFRLWCPGEKPKEAQIKWIRFEHFGSYPYLVHDSDKINESYRRNQIGLGWNLNIDYIENYEGSKTLYLDGGTAYGIDLSSESGLKEHKTKEMVFDIDESYTQVESNTKSKYSLKYKDGTKKYFDKDGYLISVVNKYDQAINYYYKKNEEFIGVHDKLVIDRIVDHVGRATNIQYLIEGNNRKIEVIKPDNSKITYLMEPISGLNTEGAIYKLSEIIDELGRVTRYEYALRSTKESIKSKKDLTQVNNQLLLERVVYPTGAYNQYVYEKSKRNNGEMGAAEYYRIESKFNSENTGERSSIVNYQYEKNYTGFGEKDDPNNLPSDYQYKTKVIKNGVTTVYTFNNKHQIIKSEMFNESSQIIKSEHNEYDENKNPTIKKNRVYEVGNYSKYNETIVTTKYDDFGNLLESTNINNQKTINIYDSKFHTLKKSTFEEAPNNKQIIENALDSKGNIIRSESYALKNGTKVSGLTSNTEYYNSGLAKGKVKREWTTAEGKTSDTRYEYSDTYKGAYPTKVTTKYQGYDGNKNLVNKEVRKLYGYNFSNGLLLYEKTLDKSDRVLSHITFEYDALGRRIGTRNQLAGISTQTDIDDANNIVTITEENGFKHRTLYDSLGREYRKEKLVSGSWVLVSQAKYDDNNRVIESRDGVGNITRTTYDILGRPLITTLPDGNTVRKLYDDYNRTTTSINEIGIKNVEKSDKNGNLISLVTIGTGGDRREITKTYDSMNRLISTTDPKGNTTSNSYDDFGRLIRVSMANGKSNTYAYDKWNNLVRINTAGGTVTRREYDELGRQIREISSLNKDEVIAYDELGRIQYKWDKAGNGTTFIYDNRSRIIRENRSDSTVVYEYSSQSSFDKKNIILDGEKTSIVYEKSGDIRSKTEGGKTISYVYDNAGRTTRITDQNGDITEYRGYDFRGNPSTVVVNGSAVTNYEYYQDGKVKTKNNTNGTKEQLSYNQFGLISSQKQYIKGNLKKSYYYDYDKNGNKTRKSEEENNKSKVTTYKYDELNRNIEVEYPDKKIEKFTFDGNGNIQLKTTYLGKEIFSKEVFTFDSDNKLIKNKFYGESFYEVKSRRDIYYEGDKIRLQLQVKDKFKEVVPKDTLSKAKWTIRRNYKDINFTGQEIIDDAYCDYDGGGDIPANLGGNNGIIPNLDKTSAMVYDIEVGDEAFSVSIPVGMRPSSEYIENKKISISQDIYRKDDSIEISVSGLYKNGAPLADYELEETTFNQSQNRFMITPVKDKPGKWILNMNESTWNSWNKNSPIELTVNFKGLEKKFSIRKEDRKKIVQLNLTRNTWKMYPSGKTYFTVTGKYEDGSNMLADDCDRVQFSISNSKIRLRKSDKYENRFYLNVYDSDLKQLSNEEIIRISGSVDGITATANYRKSKMTLTVTKKDETKLEYVSGKFISKDYMVFTVSGTYDDGSTIQDWMLDKATWSGYKVSGKTGRIVEVEKPGLKPTNPGNGGGLPTRPTNGNDMFSMSIDLGGSNASVSAHILGHTGTVSFYVSDGGSGGGGDMMMMMMKSSSTTDSAIDMNKDFYDKYNWDKSKTTGAAIEVGKDFYDDKKVNTDKTTEAAIMFSMMPESEPMMMSMKTAAIGSPVITEWKIERHNPELSLYRTNDYIYDANGNIVQEKENLKVKKVYTYNSLNQLKSFENKTSGTRATYEYYPQGLRKSKTVQNAERSVINGRIDFYYHGENVIMETKGSDFFGKYVIGLG